MKRLFPGLLVAFFALFTAQVLAQTPLSKTPSGYIYQHLLNTGGKKGATGDVASFRFTIYDSLDHVLDRSGGAGLQMPSYQLAEPASMPLLDEVFRLSAAGDSLLLLLQAEDIFGNNLPPQLQPGQSLKLGLKVVALRTQQEMEQAIQQAMADEAKQTEAQKAKDEAAIAAYVKQRKLAAKRTDSGLYYTVDKKGTGPLPKPGDLVKVHYTGTLLKDGKKFDSSLDRGEPISFVVGKGQMIPGWDEALLLLPVGSKATLLLPSHLAYGARQVGGDIPPFSALRFDIELLESTSLLGQGVQEQQTPSGFRYTKLVDAGGKKAQTGDFVTFMYTMSTPEGQIIDQSAPDADHMPYYQLSEPANMPLLDEAFRAGSVGDSLLFVVTAQEVFGPELPPGMRAGQPMKVAFRMLGLQTQAEKDAEREKAMAEEKAKVEAQKQADEQAIVQYLKDKKLFKKAQKTESGIYYVITKKTKKGAALPQAGEMVKVHYVGQLLDGKQFDSSIDRGKPFSFALAEGQVIQGWDEVLQLLPVGSKATVLIPSNLAYGSRGAGADIAPNTVLRFDMEVLGSGKEEKE